MPGVNIIRNTEDISNAPNYFLIILFVIVNIPALVGLAPSGSDPLSGLLEVFVEPEEDPDSKCIAVPDFLNVDHYFQSFQKNR